MTGACFLMRRDFFDKMGGFDTSLPVVCNDVEFCVRAAHKGGKTIIEPRLGLIHHEGVSRSGLPETEDVNRFWQLWEAVLKRDDPYFNPNLDLHIDNWAVKKRIDTLPLSRQFEIGQP